MQRLDRIHAELGGGLVAPDVLSSYLTFLEAVSEEPAFSPAVRVAVAMIDNVMALDELKLEYRRLRALLDPLECRTYDLMVRIGRKHAEIISRATP